MQGSRIFFFNPPWQSEKTFLCMNSRIIFLGNRSLKRWSPKEKVPFRAKIQWFRIFKPRLTNVDSQKKLFFMHASCNMCVYQSQNFYTIFEHNWHYSKRRAPKLMTQSCSATFIVLSALLNISIRSLKLNSVNSRLIYIKKS